MKVPFISVVVLAYNQFEYTTKPCLESLRVWFGDPEIEFIVYDNASTDGSSENARQWCEFFPSVRYVQSPANLGYAGGMNAGAKFANGQWLFLVNNDTEFPANTLDALKQVLHSAPAGLGMIGPVTNSAGNGQRMFDPSKTKQEWLELGAWLNTNPTNLLIPTYRCDFFCVAIRHTVWNNLNGLDPSFGMGYYEDFDFSLRLREAGHEQAICEDVFVYHQGSASFGLSNQLKNLIEKNKKILKARHKKIKFLHVRTCNLLILQGPTYACESKQNRPLDLRRKIRFDALREDLPKIFLKKILWNYSIKKIKKFSSGGQSFGPL